MLLIGVCPNISRIHRPDFEAIRKINLSDKGFITARDRKVLDIENFLPPQLNLEDLSKHSNLLLLLESRSIPAPEIFANADLAVAHLGRYYGAIKTEYLGKHTMYLKGRTTPETYG